MQRYLIIIFIFFTTFLLSACKAQTVEQQAVIVPTDSAVNESVGNLYLARNKSKPGVVTLPSGLQYSIVKDGYGGNPPTMTDKVTVYYQGRYISGDVFDDAHAQDAPITLPVASLLPGWQEAIKMMTPGSIWVLYLPAKLAYGANGFPGKVGPNQALIYSIHLLNINNG